LGRDEAMALGVAVPPEAKGAVRLVEAEGFDLQPCGGTHPRNTAEVGVVAVAGTERYKGGTRVRFLCGSRAVAAFREGRTTLDRLGALFSAPPCALPEAAARALAQVDELTRRARDLNERALEGEARRLLADAAGTPAVVAAVYDGWPPADLRTLALRLVALRPCVALLGSRGDKAYVTLAQTEGAGHDLPALLQEALREIEGKGGGRGNLVQGAGSRTEALGPLLDRLAARLRPSA
jgi:alanyl-tRNA synthetase